MQQNMTRNVTSLLLSSVLALLPFLPKDQTTQLRRVPLFQRPPSIQRQTLQRAKTLLGRMENGTLKERDVPTSILPRRYQQLAGEEQTFFLRDVVNGVVHEPLSATQHRKYAASVGKEDVKEWNTPEERQRRQLQALQDSLRVNVLERAVEQPNASLEHLVTETLTELPVDKIVNWDHYDWHDFPWKRQFELTEEDVANQNPLRQGQTIAYLTLHTDEAFDTYHAHHDKPYFLRTNDVRTGEITNLEILVRNARGMRETLQDNAETTDVGKLAYAVGSNFGHTRSPRITAERRDFQENTSKQPVDVTLEKLVQATLPRLGDLYADDIDTVVIADRGGRLFGLILETLMDETQLPDLDVNYFKFSKPGKIAEAFGQTRAATDALEHLHANYQTVFERGRTLRQLEGEARRDGRSQESKRLRDQIKSLISSHDTLYKTAYHEAFQEQVGVALHYIGDLHGKKTRFFDENVTSGGTRANALAIARSLGASASPSDFVPVLDSKANTGGDALIRDPQGMLDGFAEKQGWRYTLVGRDKFLPGVVYGIDRDVVDTGELFRRRRDVHAVAIPSPAGDVYTEVERAAVVDELLDETVLGDYTGAGEYRRELDALFTRFGREEKSFDGFARQVNSYLARASRTEIREAVRAEVDRLCDRLGPLTQELVESFHPKPIQPDKIHSYVSEVDSPFY